MSAKLNCLMSILLLVVTQLSGCSHSPQPTTSLPPPTSVNTDSIENSHKRTELLVKPFISAAIPLVDDNFIQQYGDKMSTAEDVQTYLSEGITSFVNTPISDLTAPSKYRINSTNLKSGILMVYAGNPPSSAEEVPLIMAGLGEAVNRINANGIIWNEDGTWKSQPYPQARDDISRLRSEVLGKGPFQVGVNIRVQQQGNLAAVINDLGFNGTHRAQEVHLLKRENGVWKIVWVPVYDQWQLLWNASVEFKEGLRSFVVHRTDPGDPSKQWDETWRLIGEEYKLTP